MSAPDPQLRADAPRTVAVTGSHGLVGSALVRSLEAEGHRVVRLVRSRPPAGSRDVYWDPARGEIDAAGLEGVDAVVHLAGASIARRWTAEHRRSIRESRVEGTGLLARALAGLASPPEVLVSASAVGYYGSRGDERLDETTAPGSGFLAEVSVEWEGAAEPARQRGIRVVHTRFGIVLAREGGVLGVMLRPFRLGLGGRAGSGGQWVSWIALDDVVAALRFAIENRELRGPVNVVAPKPATNAELTRALGRVLRRPTFLPVPAAAFRLALGREMADETLLASQRAVPARLLDAGFRFRFPELEGALRAVLER